MRGKRVAVGLSGGLDSVVLLHVLRGLAPRLGFRLSAVHVHHGLSPNANDWQRFCSKLCLDLEVPFKAIKVKVRKSKLGLEAAARAARRAALAEAPADAIALAHHLDDQAETVLFNLLRGAGVEGASGMPAVGRLGRKKLLRPLLGMPRGAIRAYAAEHRLAWIEDESNADEALTRNFLRRRVGPMLETRFPRWRENLARAARHFAATQVDARSLLRAYLKGKGLRAPSEAKLVEMLKQLGAGKGAIEHEGKVLRLYRGKTYVTKKNPDSPFLPLTWQGESRINIPALGGELRFRRARGRGIARKALDGKALQVRLRSGGERLQPDPRRPRRTLKNLFQEAGVPPWERARLPLLYCGDALVWAPGLGVDAKFLSVGRALGIVPRWRPSLS
ncbi:MAG: tRNA lysidine(34) synthetase TilS [Burkholderiales bacterium]